MPAVRGTNAPVILAVCASDIHVWHKPPVARSAEPDWWEAQRRPLLEVQHLCNQYKCPFIIAGDIFDRWSAVPETINFLMKWLPYPTYAIPGQHDLQNHVYKHIHRSAFWTLVEAGRVRLIEPNKATETHDLVLWGFPWGFPVTPCPEPHVLDGRPQVAVVHAYVWTKGRGHLGADEKYLVSGYSKELKGYWAAIFGDNHLGFSKVLSHGCTLFNCGGFMRRRSDEVDYRPQVGLLRADGSVATHYLDCSEDRFLDAPRADTGVGVIQGMDEFLVELSKLGDKALDFPLALRHYCDREGVNENIRQVIFRSLEGSSQR